MLLPRCVDVGLGDSLLQQKRQAGYLFSTLLTSPFASGEPGRGHHFAEAESPVRLSSAE